MGRAVAVGELGRWTAPPNPWVGCVIAKGGDVVAEGFHRAAGEAHAEVNALKAAGDRAHGATAYVTLEPCSHHGRTPPCVDALLEAGVQRVVVAVLDPDARVSGAGVERLRAAGVRVDVGACREAAERSLAPYLLQRRTGRAYCLAKVAVSLDGRTAAADGSSKWITGELARADAHVLRAESQAIVVGAGTALADRPSLTVRGVEPPPARPPLRVLVDGAGRVPADGPLFDLRLAPTLVLTALGDESAAVRAWRDAGADVERLPPSQHGAGLDLFAALRALGRRGVIQALVEGGAALHGALVRERLVDRLVVYVAPVTLGEQGRPLLAGPGPRTIGEATRWRLDDVRQIAQDVRLDYRPATEEPA